MEYHIVSKSNNRIHAAISVDLPAQRELETMPSNSVRVQPVVLGLTSNNLSYARLGDLLHWWDTFPVPKTAPEPYNDRTQWGIVPAWGYGMVIESNVSSLQPGRLLFGYWPMASAPVTLELQSSESKGYWNEISQQRKAVMSVYNEYREMGHHTIESDVAFSSKPSIAFTEAELNQMAWMSLFGAVWQTGFLLNKYTFTSDAETHIPSSPMGNLIPWDKERADLSDAVLISLSASGKTARGFAWQVLNKRSPTSGPKAFLQVTQATQAIRDVASDQASISAQVFEYSQLDSLVNVAAIFNPRKVVIVDFGARDNASSKLMDYLMRHPDLKDVVPMIVHVGGEQKVYSADESRTLMEDAKRFSKIRCNTANILDDVIAAEGLQKFQDELQRNWEEWINAAGRNIPDLKLIWGQGVSGESGIEEGWDRIINGSVAPDESLVYRMW